MQYWTARISSYYRSYPLLDGHMLANVTTILIVGGGRAGLQLALGLQQTDYDVTVVSNRTPTTSATGFKTRDERTPAEPQRDASRAASETE